MVRVMSYQRWHLSVHPDFTGAPNPAHDSSHRLSDISRISTFHRQIAGEEVLPPTIEWLKQDSLILPPTIEALIQGSLVLPPPKEALKQGSLPLKR